MAAHTRTEPSHLAVSKVLYDKILLFGDSLTELSSDVLSLSFALTPALQHHYFRKLSVVPRGYGGYSSEHLRHVLAPTIRAETAAGEKIKLLVLEVGTNDAAEDEMQFVEVERYRENLQFMIETARSEGVENVAVVGLGPVDEDQLETPADKSTTRNLQYADAAKDVSKKCAVPFVDLWHAFLLSTGWQEGQPIPGQRGSKGTQLQSLLTDGVHFSGKGYRIWYDALLKTIRDSFPSLRTEALPAILPHIFDVDRSILPDTLWQVVKAEP